MSLTNATLLIQGFIHKLRFFANFLINLATDIYMGMSGGGGAHSAPFFVLMGLKIQAREVLGRDALLKLTSLTCGSNIVL
jgi:hypothetical protein